MSMGETIHNVTNIRIGKRTLDLGHRPDRDILDIAVTFKVSSLTSNQVLQETLVTKELVLFLDKKYVLDIPEDALL
jgi:hypothetical protein